MSDIAYEADGYFVVRVPYGFDVYETGITSATRRARIGFKGQVGLDRAKAEIERRRNSVAAKAQG